MFDQPRSRMHDVSQQDLEDGPSRQERQSVRPDQKRFESEPDSSEEDMGEAEMRKFGITKKVKEENKKPANVVNNEVKHS